MTSKRSNVSTVAVIGAGPYGLSVAAHLRHAGISTRLFGEPMAFWRRHMPNGMLLRSPWRASHLSHPDRAVSLDAYAAAAGIRMDALLPREDFVAYGEWFQRHVAPDIDRRTVARLDAAGNCFQLTLGDGETFAAERVVVAVGLANQDYRPPVFAGLPAALVTHACEHTDFAPWRGRRVAVIGRGQSACESAALLAEAGAEVELIGRGDIRWLAAEHRRRPKTPLARLHKALSAPTAVGPFPLDWLVEAPQLVRHLPAGWRAQFTERCLQPAAAGWLKPRFDKVRCRRGGVATARAVGGEVELVVDGRTLRFEHVVLGTGYRIDLARVPMLSPRLLSATARIDGSPLLGAGFESTVPGLHFVGCYAVKSFGPLMRFIAGAGFAARAVASAARREPAAAADRRCR